MFTLSNKLQVLLIEDNNKKDQSKGDAMAYCSLAVNAGSFNDPTHR